ncbi:MAG TPA: hypothetical protein VJV78_12965 [Polyangiales bacterium]|nr:hypothetical protein [Polyangiales bacterium]
MARNWLRVAYCAALVLAAACEREVEYPGQLILAIDTDMAIPDQIDALQIEVLVHGNVAFSDHFDIGPNQATLPATLTFVSDKIGDGLATVRVSGSKQAEWQTFREAITTVPRDRIATLRMPLQWLCRGQAEPVNDGDNSPLKDDRAQSTCGSGNTCRAGSCEPSEVDGEDLPDYRPEDLYGGGETPEAGNCFDTLGCMEHASPATPDVDCTIERPAADRWNVALQVALGGICDSDGTNCYVTLNANHPEGWSLAGARVKLPPAACERLGDGSVRAVVVSDACKPKTERVPACGPWSEVGSGS